MDHFLHQLESSGLGLSVNEFYAGGFLHAHDISNLSSGAGTLEKQAALVNSFADKRFFQLNVRKCEVVCFVKSSCNKALSFGHVRWVDVSFQ